VRTFEGARFPPERLIEIVSLNHPEPSKVFYRFTGSGLARVAIEVIENLAKVYRMRDATRVLLQKVDPNNLLAWLAE
jgi:hypothetical protein